MNKQKIKESWHSGTKCKINFKQVDSLIWYLHLCFKDFQNRNEASLVRWSSLSIISLHRLNGHYKRFITVEFLYLCHKLTKCDDESELHVKSHVTTPSLQQSIIRNISQFHFTRHASFFFKHHEGGLLSQFVSFEAWFKI